MTFTIDLPLPPSTNRIWRHAKGRTFISPEYRDWKKVADGYLLAARPHGWTELVIKGGFELEMLVRPGRGDPDNRAKAVLDWLQSRAVIENDKHLRKLTVVVGACPLGCRVTVTPV